MLDELRFTREEALADAEKNATRKAKCLHGGIPHLD
jgi:hypothetical protein